MAPSPLAQRSLPFSFFLAILSAFSLLDRSHLPLRIRRYFYRIANRYFLEWASLQHKKKITTKALTLIGDADPSRYKRLVKEFNKNETASASIIKRTLKDVCAKLPLHDWPLSKVKRELDHNWNVWNREYENTNPKNEINPFTESDLEDPRLAPSERIYDLPDDDSGFESDGEPLQRYDNTPVRSRAASPQRSLGKRRTTLTRRQAAVYLDQ